MIQQRTFGVEIEAAGVDRHIVAEALTAAGIRTEVQHYNHETSHAWKIVSDASVGGEHGFELVSPVLKGDSGINELKTVCRVLKSVGVKSNNSCGLHVHVGIGDYEVKHMAKLMQIWLMYEGAIESLVAPSRVNKKWCQRVSPRYAGWGQGLTHAFDTINGITTMQGFKSAHNCNRYHALNLEPMFKYGTVECRLHQGCTDADKVTAWVQFITAIVEHAAVNAYTSGSSTLASGIVNDLRTLLMMLPLKSSVREFLMRRPEQIQRNCKKELLAPRFKATDEDVVRRTEEARSIAYITTGGQHGQA